MEKENLYILMEIAMKEIGWKIKQMGLVDIRESLEDFMREDGKMTSHKVLELNHGEMATFIKVNLERV